jgi:hypothetical protein
VHAPLRGFGYNVALTADRSILSGIPASAYGGSPSLAGEQRPGLRKRRIHPRARDLHPVSQRLRSGQLHAQHRHVRRLGVDYEGKNNAYYQPPFAIVDFQFRQPFGRHVDFNSRSRTCSTPIRTTTWRRRISASRRSPTIRGREQQHPADVVLDLPHPRTDADAARLGSPPLRSLGSRS